MLLVSSVAEPPLFGRLRKSEVPEPTPALAPTKLGRLQPKKAAPALAPYTNFFHFELLKSELIMQVFFESHLLLYIDLKSCFVTTRSLSFSACQKDASGAGVALNKAAPANKQSAPAPP